MTNISVIENKISQINKYLNILEKYKKHTKEEIISSIDLKGTVERYLYLVIQTAIDLAEAIISYKKLRKPTTMGESFSILKEENIIGKELEDELIKMVGFRNILAHEYEDIDYDILYEVLTKKTKDIEKLKSEAVLIIQ